MREGRVRRERGGRRRGGIKEREGRGSEMLVFISQDESQLIIP